VPTLQSIERATVPTGHTAELLVVDNGSIDNTKEAVLAMNAPHLSIRYILEPRKGKGHAYNTGIAAARGGILLFTDDDVRVHADWIDGMCRPIISGSADAVQGGIRIAPHLDRRWLTGSLRIWVAAVEDPIHPPEGLVGANMAFRRDVAQLVGGFDPRLGPGASGFFDDTVFGWAVARAGKKIAYCPEVAVEHHFSADRLTPRSYILAARRMAVSHAIVIRDQEPLFSPPTMLNLLQQIPGLVVRGVTQLIWFAIDNRPDPGFVVRYYQVLLWRCLRIPAGKTPEQPSRRL